jgi:hypothetical protein
MELCKKIKNKNRKLEITWLALLASQRLHVLR